MEAPDLGFSWRQRKSGDIVIDRHGHQVAILRGDAASRFLRAAEQADGQQVMARFTGDYRRGNERDSSSR